MENELKQFTKDGWLLWNPSQQPNLGLFENYQYYDSPHVMETVVRDLFGGINMQVGWYDQEAPSFYGKPAPQDLPIYNITWERVYQHDGPIYHNIDCGTLGGPDCDYVYYCISFNGCEQAAALPEYLRVPIYGKNYNLCQVAQRITLQTGNTLKITHVGNHVYYYRRHEH